MQVSFDKCILRSHSWTIWHDKQEHQHYHWLLTQAFNFSCDRCTKISTLKMHLDFAFIVRFTFVAYTLRICPKPSLYCIGQHLHLDRRFSCKLFVLVNISIRSFISHITLGHWVMCVFLFYFFWEEKVHFYCYSLFKLSQNSHWKTNMLNVIASGKYSVSILLSLFLRCFC